MTPGTKVRTRSGRVGIIQRKPYQMPLYHLVKLDDGGCNWIRTDLLKPQKRTKSESRQNHQPS